VKKLPVGGVMKLGERYVAQRCFVHKFGYPAKQTAVQKSISQPGDSWDAADPRPVRCQATVDIGLDGKVEDDIWPFAPVDAV